MGVKVIKRAYKNQFHNSSQETDWLLGNVGDFQRLELDFEVSIDFYATQQESVSVDSLQNTFKLNNGKGWQDYGFDIGDSVVFSYVFMFDTDNDGVFGETPVVLTFNIVNIYNDTMEVDINLDFDQYDIFPTDRGNVKIKDVFFVTLKDPEGLKFRYTHLTNENHESDNLVSFIDGSVTEFSFAGLQDLIPNVNEDMNPDGIQSGMAIDRVQIMKLSDNAGVLQKLTLGTQQSFRLYTYKWLWNNDVKWDYQAQSIGMTLNTPGNELQSVGSGQIPMNAQGYYINSNSSFMFINQSQVGGIRYFNANINFRVVNTNDNSPVDKVRLIAVRYNNNGAYNYSQRIVLKEWNNASSLTGISLHYIDTMGLPLDPGDSYCIAVEYYHPAQTEQQRFVDIVIDWGFIEEAGGGATKTYRVTTDFMLASFMEQPSNFEDMVAPSILFNAGSLTDNFELEVFPEWNNPNTSISNNLDHTERLGNTGWFDENFNGLDNNFVIESVAYFDDDGNQLTQLDYAIPVNVEVVVSGIANLSTQSEFGLGFSWVPQNDEDYHNKETPFHQNLFVNTGRKYVNGVNDSFNLAEVTAAQIFEGNTNDVARMDLQATQNVMFNIDGTDKVRMKTRFIPNAEFTSLFDGKSENDRKYILWISVADHNLQINFSDRVSLLIDYKDMIKTIPPAGPYPDMTNKFIEHPQDADVTGVDLYSGFIEDDVLSRVGFRVNTNDNKVLRSMTFGYEVENVNTGLTYILEKKNVNLTIYPTDTDGVQLINVDEVRGFKMNTGNNKNWVKIFRDDSFDDGDNKFYRAFFATKIRWEDWIARDGVPTEFFDASLENNGYHNDWIGYLRAGEINTHKINLFIYTEVFEDGEIKQHKNTFEINLADYDENLNIETTHEYFRYSDGTVLNIGNDDDTGAPLGVLLSNEPTLIMITYTNLTEDFDINKMYAVTTMEVEKGSGEFEHRQLSNVWSSENDNFLIPLPGDTKLNFVQVAPRIVKAMCLVEPANLLDALKYKVSGRIGCFPEGNGNGQTQNGKYEAKYEAKYE